MGALRTGLLFVDQVVMLAPSPRVHGFVPCGACEEFVMKCPHYKPLGGRTISRPIPTGAHSVRQDAVSRAGNRCQTCGRAAVVLFVRCVSRNWYRGRIRADNVVAVCAICRTAARGIGISQWVARGAAPALAGQFIARRERLGLPV